MTSGVSKARLLDYLLFASPPTARRDRTTSENGGAISATRTRPRLPRVIWRYVTYGALAASTRLQSCDLHNSRPTAHPVIFNWSGFIW